MSDVSAPIAPAPAAEADVSPAAPDRRRYDRSFTEGPLRSAVWKIAWPTMLTNVFGGLQGMIDHALVGNLVGFKANAAIGVSWQILIVVIVFISSLFTGMSVLVARFAGAGGRSVWTSTARGEDSGALLNDFARLGKGEHDVG